MKTGSKRKKSAEPEGKAPAPSPAKLPAPESRELLVGFSPEAASTADAASIPATSSFQSNLLSLLSHEIRTPLMGILNGVLLLEMERPLEARSEGEKLALDQIQRNGSRLKSLIQSLLDLAVIDAQAVHPHLREIELLSWAKELFPKWIQPSQNGSDARVLADPEKLNRALSLIFQRLQQVGVTDIEIRFEKRTHMVLAIWFKALLPELALQIDREFREGSLLVSTGSLDPTRALQFAAGSEEAFLRVEDQGSPLSTDLPWALAVHALGIQEIQAELLSDSGAPLRRLLLLSFPQGESRYRIESLLHSRILHLEGRHGSAGHLWVAWVNTTLPENSIQSLRNDGALEPGDSLILLGDSSGFVLISENPSERHELDLKTLLKTNDLIKQSGIATYPADASDARSLLELAKSRSSTDSLR